MSGSTRSTATTGTTRALERGLKVVEALAASSGDRGAGLGEVAATVGFDKATVLRAINTLMEMGFVYQDASTSRYKLTGRFLKLALSYRDGLDLPRRAAPFLADLRERSGETVHLGIRELDQIVYISKLESQKPIKIASALGQAMPMHTTALGKAILAAMPPAEVRSVVDRLDLTPKTERSIDTIDGLQAELEATVRRGFSIDDRENEDSIVCIGAAIVDSAGEIVGALSVSGPYFRMLERVDELGEMCFKAAADLGISL